MGVVLHKEKAPPKAKQSIKQLKHNLKPLLEFFDIQASTNLMKDVCTLATIIGDGKTLQTKIAQNVFNYYDLDNSGNFCKTELKVRLKNAQVLMHASFETAVLPPQ